MTGSTDVNDTTTAGVSRSQSTSRLASAVCTVAAAACHAVGQGHGIHRPRAGAANAFNNKGFFFQKAVKHTPRVGPMGAATLQCQIDVLGLHCLPA
jgi:hypothetical protein